MWENGAWRTDGYDELAGTSYGQAMDVRMTLTVPNGVQAAFGGAWVGERDNGDGTRTLTMQLSGAREISFALRAKGAMRQTTVDGVLATALAQNARTASRLLDIAADVLEDIGQLGLAYPFPSLTVAQAKTARADGAVGSALIAVDADAKTDALLSRVTRLCARQIFGVQVENDPWNAPWLSETPASCVELLAYRRREGEAAYEKRFYSEIEIATRLTRPRGVTVGASTERFGGDGEMTQVLRDAGAAGLMGIEQAVGQAAFLGALQRYVEQNAGGVGTLEALEGGARGGDRERLERLSGGHARVLTRGQGEQEQQRRAERAQNGVAALHDAPEADARQRRAEQGAEDQPRAGFQPARQEVAPSRRAWRRAWRAPRHTGRGRRADSHPTPRRTAEPDEGERLHRDALKVPLADEHPRASAADRRAGRAARRRRGVLRAESASSVGSAPAMHGGVQRGVERAVQRGAEHPVRRPRREKAGLALRQTRAGGQSRTGVSALSAPPTAASPRSPARGEPDAPAAA